MFLLINLCLAGFGDLWNGMLILSVNKSINFNFQELIIFDDTIQLKYGVGA
jgi:hypothetical protein